MWIIEGVFYASSHSFTALVVVVVIVAVAVPTKITERILNKV